MSTSVTTTEAKTMPENKKARVQDLLNENEFSLRILQLVLKPNAEKPVDGKKERIGYESLKELATKAGVDIAELQLSTLSKAIGKNDQFCTRDCEVVSEKTLARYVKNIPENMTALGFGSEAKDEITIVVYYLTTEESKITGLDGIDTKAQVDAVANELRGKHETKPHAFIEIPKAGASETAALVKEVGGDTAPGAGADKVVTPKQMNLKQWRSVFQSLQLLNGDYIQRDHTVFKATKPAFRIHRKVDPQDYLYGEGEDKNAEQIPVFKECHETSIAISEMTSDLQKNLASTGFTEASLSVAIGASASLWAASAQAGVSYQSSNSQATSAEQSAKVVKGYWNAPRAEVTLDRNNMILDPECKAALDAIIQDEKREDVVNFYKNYGTIFAQRVALGGRLTTSKTITTAMGADTKSQQRDIHVSMEASVNVSLTAKGSVKGSFGSGSSEGEKSSNADSSTSLTWQAQGGETDLAQSPAAWLPTVKDYNTWFPIKKDGVVAMDEMISGFPGYEKIPTLFLETITQASDESPVKAPWTLEMFKDVKDSKRFAGLAIDSYTGRLKESPFEPLDWRRLSNPTQSANPDAAFCWKVLKSIEEVRKEITKSLKDSVGIDAQTNAATIPAHLYSLQASDRSLSVMMKWVSSPREHTMASHLFKLTNDAAASISKNGSGFFDKYGDHFVCGWTEQSAVIAVWTIEAKSRGEIFNNLSSQINVHFQTPRTLQEGCDFFSKDLGVTCFADVFKSSSESQAVVLKKDHVRPNQVFGLIEDLVDEDYIPTKVHLKPYRAVYLPYMFSPSQSPTTFLKKARDLFQRNIMLHVKSKASPFLRDSAPEKELVSQIKDLRSTLEQQWNSCVTDKGLGIFKDLELKHSECEDKLSMRFFARDWLRDSIYTENADISTNNSSYHYYTKTMGLLEPHTYAYDSHIVEKVKGCLTYFEDKKSWDFSLWQSHDNKRNFEINQSHTYYLVAYQMRSQWGDDTNGYWWIESNDRNAVARRNPRITHRKADLHGYKWSLESWWLPKESFPFIDEEIQS